ncbi:hypothetical protein RO3G_00279 [Rhizopus delemar RA 99-880]|uniref:Uncharacterized protein n=1 Tax=Rhizopus delemar (strain RA 99-880 / ATCC MYA-4621 / FGSC 9543 / NRRL 43880) TaxID=246409 RepID=I1BH95_RHIO9|nr:hypothetical protein RO3G_00279 [Rhizopus delemar RA 99-880]|eukprot:EIE75575.1 hypothetical protein RO3G_00279 [Rhizopus delemar RA 99-880]
MYQKENNMVSIDSTGSDEESCGVKDDTKHYDCYVLSTIYILLSVGSERQKCPNVL